MTRYGLYGKACSLSRRHDFESCLELAGGKAAQPTIERGQDAFVSTRQGQQVGVCQLFMTLEFRFEPDQRLPHIDIIGPEYVCGMSARHIEQGDRLSGRQRVT